MRILHLIYTNGIAGAEKYLLHLLPGLAANGIECHLVVVCSGQAKPKLKKFFGELNEHGIPVNFIESRKVAFFFAAMKVLKYLRKNKIRFIHSHLLNSDVIATIAGYFSPNTKIISTKHGYSELILRQVPFVPNFAELIPSAKKDFYYRVTKWVVKRAYSNYAVSKAISDLYFELGLSNSRMPFIHHGLDIDAYDSGVRKPFSIVIIGRLEEFKGHRYLIEAIAQVKKVYPSVALTVIGEGSAKNSLEQLVKKLNLQENVTFTGFSNDPYKFVTSASIVALPSLFEPFGLVYLEAMALKRPVVAFDTAAGNEILDKETAMLAKPADTSSLANCIITLLKNPQYAEQLAENAYNKYKEQFTTLIMVKNTADYYKTILY